jgi:hypothetical protein
MQKGVTAQACSSLISDADFTDSFGEASALAKHLAEEQQRSGSALIRDLAHVHGTGFASPPHGRRQRRRRSMPCARRSQRSRQRHRTSWPPTRSW